MAAQRSRSGRGSNQYRTVSASLPSPRFVNGGVEPPPPEDLEAAAWAFHPDRGEWDAVGLNTWSEVNVWRSHGFDNPRVAAGWRNDGFDAPAAAEWARYGNEPPAAQAWVQAGITDADEATTWDLIDLDPVECSQWKAAGVTDPYEARAWADIVGKGTASGAEQWIRNGFDAATAASWVRIGVTAAHIAVQWRSADVTADHAGRWAFEIGIGRVPPSFLLPWINNGFDPPDRLQWGMLVGFSAAAAAVWRDHGWHPRAARVLVTAGVGVDEADRRRANGKSLASIIYDRTDT